jgi:hypothetical protein
MEELKLCPFCGGEADWSAGIGWFAIVCQTCFVETEAYSSADDAQGVWNRRASLVQGTEATAGGGASYPTPEKNPTPAYRPAGVAPSDGGQQQ